MGRRAAIELSEGGAVIGGRASPWLMVQEKAHRAITALSARLRLAPQSRQDSRSAGRKAGQPVPGIYDLMRLGEDAE